MTQAKARARTKATRRKPASAEASATGPGTSSAPDLAMERSAMSALGAFDFLSPQQREGLEQLSINLARAAMAAQGAFRQAEGWMVEEIPHNCAFFFCSRGNERICVAIECYEPGKAPTGHGSVIGH